MILIDIFIYIFKIVFSHAVMRLIKSMQMIFLVNTFVPSDILHLSGYD